MTYKKLLIFHYHLRAGGITQVIERSVKVLNEKSSIEIMIISGSDTDSPSGQRLASLGAAIKVHEDPLIGYSLVVENQTIERLERHLLENYHQADTLWWIHNYHLGKNPAFTAALIRIAHSACQPMLLQIHDFPEENRPQNLKQLALALECQTLYPYNSKIHYLVVNYHDQQRLIKAGLPKQAVSKLFNLLQPQQSFSQLRTILEKQEIRDILAKKFGTQFPAFSAKKPLALYPVRAIRRKNILEAIALNLLCDGQWNLLITLAGTSSSEKSYSNLVKQLFVDLRIPGLTEIGESLEPELSFPQLFKGADTILSTSLAEGFGYTFFDALQTNKPMFARLLPVLEGFLPLFNERQFFYKKFYLELNKEQFAECQQHLKQCIRRATPMLHKKLEKEIQGLKKDSIDFALLAPKVQYQLLLRLHKDSCYRQQQQQLNHRLLAAAQKKHSDAAAVDLSDVFGEQAFYQSYQKIVSKLKSTSFSETVSKISIISENLRNQLDDITSYSPILSDNREWQCILEGGSFE